MKQLCGIAQFLAPALRAVPSRGYLTQYWQPMKTITTQTHNPNTINEIETATLSVIIKILPVFKSTQ